MPHKHRKDKCDRSKKCGKTYDFVVVGAGNAGCTIANRLSESGKHTVCLLEVGRDDSRLPDLLPLASPASVPQPGDYQWGKYTRGSAATNFPSYQINRGFSQFDWFQEGTYTTTEGEPKKRSTDYSRNAGWGGCTSHNFGFNIRNTRANWQEWVDRGLTDFDASTPTSNLIKYYKLVENRTQLLAPGVPFYDSSLPAGTQGSNSTPDLLNPGQREWYGTNGTVPILNLGPFLGNETNPTVRQLTDIVANVLNPAGYNYPTTLVDLDYPPTAAEGGLSFNNFTYKFQFGEITPPPGFFGLPQVSQPLASYNTPMYPNEPLMLYPPEFLRLGISGPTVFERVMAAQSYLYPAQSRTNLTIKSEVLATKVITEKNHGVVKATGVKYLKGWNIYQTGRNNNVQMCGYGGTAGDARANALLAKRQGSRKVYARKEVILCAGAFNTPQILQLSGIGDKNFLSSMDICPVADVPGVGEHLIDNQEIFLVLEGNSIPSLATLAAKSDPSKLSTDFDLTFIPVPSLANEALDTFVQKGLLGVKSDPAIYTKFNRNKFENILVNTNQNPADPKDVIFDPIITFNSWVFYFEQEDGNKTEGTVKIVSKDPTVPPKLVFNYMSHPQDEITMVNFFNNIAFPIMLGLKTPLPDPSGTTVLSNGSQNLPVDVFNAQSDPAAAGFPSSGVLLVTNNAAEVQVLTYNGIDSIGFGFLNVSGGNGTIDNGTTVTLAGPWFFSGLLDPAPVDFLKAGVTYSNWTSVDQVDQERLLNYLRARVGGHHAGGTCKMGVTNPAEPKYDPLAVVNQKGQVKNVKNLRVCDNSVVPVSIRWPNGTLYVVAEKISNDILNSW